MISIAFLAIGIAVLALTMLLVDKSRYVDTLHAALTARNLEIAQLHRSKREDERVISMLMDRELAGTWLPNVGAQDPDSAGETTD